MAALMLTPCVLGGMLLVAFQPLAASESKFAARSMGSSKLMEALIGAGCVVFDGTRALKERTLEFFALRGGGGAVSLLLLEDGSWLSINGAGQLWQVWRIPIQ